MKSFQLINVFSINVDLIVRIMMAAAVAPREQWSMPAPDREIRGKYVSHFNFSLNKAIISIIDTLVSFTFYGKLVCSFYLYVDVCICVSLWSNKFRFVELSGADMTLSVLTVPTNISCSRDFTRVAHFDF